MADIRDLLAYIRVLDVPEASSQVPQENHMIHIMGCLIRVEDTLGQMSDAASQSLLALIKEREKINNYTEHGDPKLIEITRKCALVCAQYYNMKTNVDPEEEKKVLTSIDSVLEEAQNFLKDKV